MSLISAGSTPETISVERSTIWTCVKDLRLSSMFSAVCAGETDP